MIILKGSEELQDYTLVDGQVRISVLESSSWCRLEHWTAGKAHRLAAFDKAGKSEEEVAAGVADVKAQFKKIADAAKKQEGFVDISDFYKKPAKKKPAEPTTPEEAPPEAETEAPTESATGQ